MLFNSIAIVRSNFDIDSNWGDATINGLSEVRMVVPEPATMALLAFGGLGILLRRKRR